MVKGSNGHLVGDEVHSKQNLGVYKVISPEGKVGEVVRSSRNTRGRNLPRLEGTPTVEIPKYIYVRYDAFWG